MSASWKWASREEAWRQPGIHLCPSLSPSIILLLFALFSSQFLSLFETISSLPCTFPWPTGSLMEWKQGCWLAETTASCSLWIQFSLAQGHCSAVAFTHIAYLWWSSVLFSPGPGCLGTLPSASLWMPESSVYFRFIVTVSNASSLCAGRYRLHFCLDMCNSVTYVKRKLEWMARSGWGLSFYSAPSLLTFLELQDATFGSLSEFGSCWKQYFLIKIDIIL